MPVLKILPNPTKCPEGISINADSGDSICDALLSNGVNIEKICNGHGTCNSCHVVIIEGVSSLNESTDLEEFVLSHLDLLEPNSRLSCQTLVSSTDLVIDIPHRIHSDTDSNNT